MATEEGGGKAARAAQDSGRVVNQYIVRTGNAMIDQFQPWYFGVAFAFIFKYCTGMPDMPAFMKRPRYRRKDGAPRVEAPLWVRIMSRRVEAQVARDWQFGFVSWNYVFRSAVNLSRTWYAYTSVSAEGVVQKMTPEQIGHGAMQLTKALWGKYQDVDGNLKSVAGDMTKLKFVCGNVIENIFKIFSNTHFNPENTSLLTLKQHAVI